LRSLVEQKPRRLKPALLGVASQAHVV
jgi:hypothetical protein